MNTVIFSVSKAPPNSVSVWVEESPVHHDDAQIPQPLDLSGLPPMGGAAETMVYAKMLRDQLLAVDAFRPALNAVFRAPIGTPAQLKFWVRHPYGDGYSWEALVNENEDYIALASRSQVSRQVKRGGAPPEFALFRAPLKILAVFSAIGISADGEWEALKKALAGALIEGLVKLHILSCEPPLRAKIQAEGLPGVTVDAIPDSVNRLKNRIAEVEPHILHFFCHGKVTSGAQTLEMVTSTEWLSVAPTGALSLGIDQLAGDPAVKQAWFVVLNCCQGGAPAQVGEGLKSSMAKRLVEAGVPAAIGMTSPIDAADAHETAEAFYSKAIRQLRPLLRGQAAVFELDLSPAVGAARDALHGKIAGGTPFSTWTLPLLYEDLKPFKIHALDQVVAALPVQSAIEEPQLIDDDDMSADGRTAERPSAPGIQRRPVAAGGPTEVGSHDVGSVQTRIQIVANFLQNLPAQAPPEIRVNALKILADAGVPEPLWPNLQGQFEAPAPAIVVAADV